MDVRRLADLLVSAQGRIVHRRLGSRRSPAVLVAIGRESVPGEADEAPLEEAAHDLIAEAAGA
jgi:ATP-dependent Lhr-like helicase